MYYLLLHPDALRVLVGGHGVLELARRPDDFACAARAVRALKRVPQLFRRHYRQALEVRVLHLLDEMLELALLVGYRQLKCCHLPNKTITILARWFGLTANTVKRKREFSRTNDYSLTLKLARDLTSLLSLREVLFPSQELLVFETSFFLFGGSPL